MGVSNFEHYVVRSSPLREVEKGGLGVRTSSFPLGSLHRTVINLEIGVAGSALPSASLLRTADTGFPIVFLSERIICQGM